MTHDTPLLLSASGKLILSSEEAFKVVTSQEEGKRPTNKITTTLRMRRLLTFAFATSIRPSTLLSTLILRREFCAAFSNPDPSAGKEMFTTNEEDQREAAKLKARLEESQGGNSTSAFSRVPSVSIDEGANKYVLISAIVPGQGSERQNFVVSRKGAEYHRNAAEPMIDALERCGYSSISILGGGRIRCDSDGKKISIYGFSYGFGQVSYGATCL